MKEKYKTRIPQYTKTYRDKKRLSGLCYEGGCNETAAAFGQQCEFHKRKATRAARDRVMGENASTHRDHLIRRTRWPLCYMPRNYDTSESRP